MIGDISKKETKSKMLPLRKVKTEKMSKAEWMKMWSKNNSANEKKLISEWKLKLEKLKEKHRMKI
eukprot:TRINITY_DN6980_c0_g1_i1.p1 TRINITY_DN6980_c0_g1~~TRINITY_DN6980_c0_g1_i1.p1  ORF type:complete len:65 (+),score=19.79 TRINITY_DN6980_c0_g1_i1:127-321(+)